MQAHHQDDVLESFKAMDRMWLAIVLDHGDDAGEVHDELFGSSDWISRLQALSERLSEFQRRWHGPAITIDNFAVTSGHEAAAMFAARLVAYAPTRARWIVTHRAELDQARAHGTKSQIAQAERNLRDAVRDFAQFLSRPFRGWFEHRAWIRRSIEAEMCRSESPSCSQAEETSESTDLERSQQEQVHWVPASILVDTNEDRFSTPAKVTAFCRRYDVPHRQGLTKSGKPWKQRCDVNLEAWRTKVAALRAEDRRLQDAADRRTADNALLKEWSKNDAN